MNMVLADCEEFRKINTKKGPSQTIPGIVEEREEKRTLGLVILRGENVVSLQVEGPPPSNRPSSFLSAGPGTATAAGRGMGIIGGIYILLYLYIMLFFRTSTRFSWANKRIRRTKCSNDGSWSSNYSSWTSSC